MIFIIGIRVATKQLRAVSKYINENCFDLQRTGREDTLIGYNYGKNIVFKL